MGRLFYLPEYAYAADVNDLLAALYQHEEARRELLVSIFGSPDDTLAPPLASGSSPRPLTPELFDSVFSGRPPPNTPGTW